MHRLGQLPIMANKSIDYTGYLPRLCPCALLHRRPFLVLANPETEDTPGLGPSDAWTPCRFGELVPF